MANISDVENIQKELEGSLFLKMAEFERRLNAASTPPNTTLVQLREEFCVFKDLVTSMLSLLRQQILDCSKNIDEINMRHRRKALLFHGIPESPELNTQNEVLQLIRGKMGLPHIADSSLKQCHRLGARQSDKVRPVLAYFHDHHNKAEVWKAKSKLKGSTVSICEFLTKTRQAVHKNARKYFGVKNVWSHDGIIHIKLPEGRKKISSEDELEALKVKFASAPSSNRAGNSPRHEDSVSVSKKVSHSQQSPSNSTCQQEIARNNNPARTNQKQSDDIKRARRFASKR